MVFLLIIVLPFTRNRLVTIILIIKLKDFFQPSRCQPSIFLFQLDFV